MSKGSVTVFFSMIMIVIISVVATSVESARLSCARLYWRQASQNSLRSVFADYYVPLFWDYGLLFVDSTYGEGEDKISERYEDYMSYMINPDKGNLIGRKVSLYEGNIENISVSGTVKAVDGGGAVLRRSAYGYMKNKLPAGFAKEFLEQLNFIKQADAIKEFFKRLEAVQKDIEAVDNVIININRLTDSVRLYGVRLGELLAEIEKLRTGKSKLLAEKEKEFEVLKADFINMVYELVSGSEVYERLTTKIREYLAALGEEFIDASELPQAVKEIIKDEIENLMIYSGGVGDIYGIESQKDKFTEIREALENWIKEQTEEQLLKLMEIEIEVSLGNDNTERPAEQPDIEGLISEIAGNGIYGIICPGYETLSTAEIKPFFNREEARKQNYAHIYADSTIDAVAEDILFNEYIQEKFTDYCNSRDDRPLKYEIEYIIGGRLRDRDNIDIVIRELLMIREGLNLIHLIGSQEKRNEAHAMAMTCVGFTGLYAAVKALEYTILAGWALAEAVIDVRTLMNGGTVPVFKTDSDWRIDLKNIVNVLQNPYEAAASPNEQSINDFAYTDYLKIILYTQDRKEQALRVMDLIEADIQNRYSARFYLNNCIYGMEMQTDYRLKPLLCQPAGFLEKETVTCRYSY